MNTAFDRRSTLRLLAAAALGSTIPRISLAAPDPYDLGFKADARILHITDTHAQVKPVYFREPSVNIGIGGAYGRPPHLVGQAYLDWFGEQPGTNTAYATTYLDFEEAAHKYGPTGGFAHIKTLLDRFRAEAGADHCLTLDGGDLWQGSAIADLTKGMALVELGNMLGLDAMTGHWEFTYGEEQLRQNLAAFKGSFIAQNVFLTDEAAFNGAKAADPASGRVFAAHIQRQLGNARIAVIGQAFPYVPIAHPRRFVPDWTFGIRAEELQQLVHKLRDTDHADVVILLSHNGMDVDLKLASVVRGIDVILGGHTHDATPRPSKVANAGGQTLVVNGGSSGKFIGVLDVSGAGGRMTGVDYRLVPVFSNAVKADTAVADRIETLRAPHAQMLGETLTTADRLLFRRGNFNGSMDDVICDALLQHTGAQIALSPGFRWGPSFLPGEKITMEDVLAHTATTYADVYVQSMTGAEFKSVLEDVCDNLFNADPFRQQGGDMARLGGVRYTCTPAHGIGSRISNLTLSDGTALDPAVTYKVASWGSVTLPQNGTPIATIVAARLRSDGDRSDAKPVIVDGVAGNPGYAS
jgi:sulfur-oxidizing protein SoxB